MSDSEHIREQVLDAAEGIDSVWGPAKRSIAELTEQNAQRIDSATDTIAAALQEIIRIMADQTRMAIVNNDYASSHFARTRDRMESLLEGTNNPTALSALAHLDAAHKATQKIGDNIGAVHNVSLAELNAKGEELLAFLGRLSTQILPLPFLDLEQAKRNGGVTGQLTSSDLFYAKVENPISQAMGDLRQSAQEL